MVALQILASVGVLALALLLRLPGLHWGLPTIAHAMLTYHPDEGSMLAICPTSIR